MNEKRKPVIRSLRPRGEAVVSPVERQPSTLVHNKVFVVHGRDEATKQMVARFLEKLGLEPVILHEKPDKGRTVIEKFESYSLVAYAVVLLTPDDVGGLASDELKLSPRSRQNVVFELGYFIGKLGRERVCALYRGVELPSDLHGVLYVLLDDEGAWKLALARELKEAGLDISPDDVFKA
jgi:predicted nucleotide-binding protein